MKLLHLKTVRQYRLVYGLLAFSILSAQILGQKTKIEFEYLKGENGLSQNNALITFQDSKGFIWIGTEDGLNCFDGYTCRIFRNIPKDSTSLSNNYVRGIVEDHKGNIWIGTQNGLNKYSWERENFKQYRYRQGDPNSMAYRSSLLIQRTGCGS